jgi:hypothetical protein
MLRLLDFALLTFLVWLVWSQLIRGWRASMAAPRGPEPAASRGAARQDEPPMTLVPCEACGVHVPSARTLPGPAGKVFCSEACRAGGARPSR